MSYSRSVSADLALTAHLIWVMITNAGPSAGVSTRRQVIHRVRGDLVRLSILSRLRICCWGLGDALQLLLHEQDAEGHHHTAHGHVGALPLTNPGAFPEYPQQSGFIFVQ